MSSFSPKPSAPWVPVLEQMDQALQQTLAAAEDLPAPEPAAVDWPAWDEALHRLRQRLDQVQDAVAKAEASAAAAAATLATDAAALARWRDAAAGRSLADGGGPTV
jgi:hypothetical protein